MADDLGAAGSSELEPTAATSEHEVDDGEAYDLSAQFSPGFCAHMESSGVAVRYTPRQGRYCVVADGRAFRKGEVVMATPPHSFVLLPTLKAQRCSYCFEGSPSLSRCSSCKTASYCSQACQKSDWKAHHKLECKYAPAFARLSDNAAADAILVVRALHTDVRERKAAAKAKAKKAKKAKDDGAANRPAPASTFADVQELVAHVAEMEAHNPTVFAENRQLAEFIHREVVVPEDMGYDVDDVLRLCTTFQINNFGIQTELLHGIGAGLYPAGAMLNHSCMPSCVLTYESRSHTQVIRALRDLGPGDEITHTFVDALTPDRHEKIFREYFFRCVCPRCVDPEWQAVDARFTALLEGVDPTEAAETLETLKAQIATAVAGDDVAVELQVLQMARTIRGKLLDPFHADMVANTSALFNAAIVSGDLHLAADYCAELISYYRHIYDQGHPMIGLQLYTLGNIYHELGRAPLAVDALMEAVVILDTTHGSGSSLVRGLGELLSYAMLGLNMGGGGGDSGEDGEQANAAAALGGSAPVDENDLL